jgi:hypothetical protein
LSNRDCDRGVLPAFIFSFAPYPVWTSSNSSTNHDILEFSNYFIEATHLNDVQTLYQSKGYGILLVALRNMSFEPHETIIPTEGLENHVKCVIRTPTNRGTE